ncbi:MAG TPA: DUF488 family protein [Burkholderiaceae bacterium]|nr:DUF488 family protein [Burkholderiaceae bacterium]
MTHTVNARRLYDALKPTQADQDHKVCRVFVDRLWPRGVARADFQFDHWCKELAPSPELRKWFDHRESRWKGFDERYRKELHHKEQKQRMHDLMKEAGNRPVDLLYGAKDTEHNHAIVLADVLQKL